MTGGTPASRYVNPSARTEPGSRSNVIDLFKLVLAVMVVGVHVPLFSDMHPDAGTVLTEGLYRIAVPSFICLTGYYLQLARPGAWFRATLRFIGLYLIWSLIYAPVWVDAVIASERPVLTLLKSMVIGYWHLWYLAALCFAIPLFALLHRAPTAHLLGIAISLFLIGLALQYGEILTVQPRNLPLHYWRNGLFLALPFLLLGHLLRRHRLAERVDPRSLLFLALASIALLMIEAILMAHFGGYTGHADFRLCLLIAAPSSVVFALSLAGRRFGTGLPKGLGDIATALYLLHPGFIITFNKVGLVISTPTTIVILVLTMASALVLIRTGLSRILL